MEVNMLGLTTAADVGAGVVGAAVAGVWANAAGDNASKVAVANKVRFMGYLLCQ
jgi:hypothetical protein